jgi:hypothetical protein
MTLRNVNGVDMALERKDACLKDCQTGRTKVDNYIPPDLAEEPLAP